MNDSPAALTTEQVLTLLTPAINYMTWKMLSHANFTATDALDIKQLFRMAVVKAYPSYDANKGSVQTYLSNVLRNVRCDIYSRRITRNERMPTVSIDLSDDDTGVTDDLSVPAESHDHFDILEIASHLSPRDRAACILLMEGSSIQDVAKRIGVSKPTFYNTILPRLRKAFAELSR